MTAVTQPSTRGPGLLERIPAGPAVCVEGCLLELERRGYLQAGALVPQVVVDHPVADESGTLLAESVCNTNRYDPDNSDSHGPTRAMFEEQVGRAAEAGVGFVIGETYATKAEIELGVIADAGLPAVITLAVGQEQETRDGDSVAEACRRLAAQGAALDPCTCTRYEIADFTGSAEITGVRYLGLCCGAGPHHVRSMAESLGREPEASRYSVDMSKHAFFGTALGLQEHNREYRDRP